MLALHCAVVLSGLALPMCVIGQQAMCSVVWQAMCSVVWCGRPSPSSSLLATQSVEDSWMGRRYLPGLIYSQPQLLS